jgi:Holliday junction resolvasome RuvABC endonuclease subunit
MVAQAKRYTRSLVVDQSTTCTGFAIIEHDPEAEVSYGTMGRLIQHGRLKLKGKEALPRMIELRADLLALCKEFAIDEIVYEQTAAIMQRSAATNEAMAGAVIAVKHTAKELSLPCYSQNPSTIKKRFTGSGKADKEAIMAAVVTNWGIPRGKILDDNHADSLAGAYVWLNMADEIRVKTKEKKVKLK